jgi:hypothetical protein
MSGTVGDGEGAVYLAHAWCAELGRKHTVGPWHWWGTYKTPEVADQRAVAESRRWGEYGEVEVIGVLGGPSHNTPRVVQMVRREAPRGHTQTQAQA